MGLDTVQLNGKYFELLNEVGNEVKVGDPIVKFDLEKIKAEGYDVVTSVIITNTNDYLDVISEEAKPIAAADKLLTVF